MAPSMATICPFASPAPIPHTRSSRISPPNGSTVHPSLIGTVSRCVLSATTGRRSRPRSQATTFGRPGSASGVATSRPELATALGHAGRDLRLAVAGVLAGQPDQLDELPGEGPVRRGGHPVASPVTVPTGLSLDTSRSTPSPGRSVIVATPWRSANPLAGSSRSPSDP